MFDPSKWPDKRYASTEAFGRFLRARNTIMEYVTMSAVLVDAIPYTRDTIREKVPHLSERLELLMRRATDNRDFKVWYPRATHELLLTRVYDAFMGYLVDVVGDAIRAQPKFVWGEDVKVKVVFECKTGEEFVERLALRRIEQLSFGGFDKITRYIRKDMNVPLAIDSGVEERATWAMETRHIVAHNRGCANEKYLRLYPNTGVKTGEEVPLDEEGVFKAVDSLTHMAFFIDQAFVTHFDMKLPKDNDGLSPEPEDGP